MTDPINTNNRPRNTGISTDTRAGASAKTSQPPAQDKAASTRSDESGVVELSGASLLAELEAQIKNLPEVNEARVDAVKQALTKGEYQPDAEVIARKYSEIEKLLP